MVHLDKIPEKTTPQLEKALHNAETSKKMWPSTLPFIRAIRAELRKR